MTEPYEIINYKGLDIKIYQDSNPINPRRDDIYTIVTWHKRYNIGDEQPRVSPEEFFEQLAEECDPSVHRRIEYWRNGKGYSMISKSVPKMDDSLRSFQWIDNKIEERVQKIIQKVLDKYLYIYPIYMYDHSGITLSLSPYNDYWDSGQLGYIYGEKKNFPKIDPYKYMEKEIETLDRYINGDIYYYLIEDKDGNDIGSCGGFYGSNWETNGLLEYARSDIDCSIQ